MTSRWERGKNGKQRQVDTHREEAGIGNRIDWRRDKEKRVIWGGGGHGEQKEKQVEIQRTKGKKRGKSDGEKR